MISKLSRALVLLAYLGSCAETATGGQGASTLYGTWRWIDTVGDLLPARGTPQTCQCARLLVLEIGNTYRYFWPDSAGGFLLAEGNFSVRDDPHSGGAGPSGVVRISFAPSFDSKRHSFPADQIVGSRAADTLFLIAHAVGHPPSNLSRRFVRELTFTGKVPEPRTEMPAPHGPLGTEKDSLTIQPASTTPRPYEDPPIPVTWVEADAARWLRGNAMGGDVLVKVLIAADGRVRDVELAGGDAEKNRPLIAAVRRWIFKPALMSGRPVATWVEIPFESTR